MTDSSGHANGDKISLGEFARLIRIEADDADTLFREILPVLKRKHELRQQKATAAETTEKQIAKLLKKDLPKVLANYALMHLQANKQVLFFLIKKIAPNLTDLRVKYLIDKQSRMTENALADQLAAKLGIRDTHREDFKSEVIPKLKKYTKAMFRKKLESGELNEDAKAYNDFIIENVFIDEFENHPFIRSVTDESNRAILVPEARAIAIKMIIAWMKEVALESKR